MKLLIVEDSPFILESLKLTIQKLQPAWEIDTADSYSSALEQIHSKEYQLFILDYELNEENNMENGYQLGIEIQKCAKHRHVPIIFETNYPNHIFQVLNQLNCIYYLVKPYTESDIAHMLKKIFSIAAEERLAFTDVNRIQFYLSPSDIMFVTAARHKLYLYTANSENICTNYTLEELETASHNQLIRCHKSHLVNPKYIQFIDKKNQYLTLEKRADGTNESVPLGRAYRNCLTLIS